MVVFKAPHRPLEWWTRVEGCHFIFAQPSAAYGICW